MIYIRNTQSIVPLSSMWKSPEIPQHKLFDIFKFPFEFNFIYRVNGKLFSGGVRKICKAFFSVVSHVHILISTHLVADFLPLLIKQSGAISENIFEIFTFYWITSIAHSSAKASSNKRKFPILNQISQFSFFSSFRRSLIVQFSRQKWKTIKKNSSMSRSWQKWRNLIENAQHVLRAMWNMNNESRREGKHFKSYLEMEKALHDDVWMNDTIESTFFHSNLLFFLPFQLEIFTFLECLFLAGFKVE